MFMAGSSEPEVPRRSLLSRLFGAPQPAQPARPPEPPEYLYESAPSVPAGLVPNAGERYEGPAAWCDGPEVGFARGPYALTADGKDLLRPLVRLVMVDDAPGDPDDGACHYEIAGPNDYPQKGRPVALEARLEGRAEVSG